MFSHPSRVQTELWHDAARGGPDAAGCPSISCRRGSTQFKNSNIQKATAAPAGSEEIGPPATRRRPPLSQSFRVRPMLREVRSHRRGVRDLGPQRRGPARIWGQGFLTGARSGVGLRFRTSTSFRVCAAAFGGEGHEICPNFGRIRPHLRRTRPIIVRIRPDFGPGLRGRRKVPGPKIRLRRIR